MKPRPIVVLPPSVLSRIIVTPDGCWRYTGTMTRGEPRTIEAVVDKTRINVRRTLFAAVRGFTPVIQTACTVGGLRCVNPNHSHAGRDEPADVIRFHQSAWNDAAIPAPPPPVCGSCGAAMPFATVAHNGTSYVETVATCSVCTPDTYVPSERQQRLEANLERARDERANGLAVGGFNLHAVKHADGVVNRVARELKAQGHDIAPIQRGPLRLRLIERNRDAWAKSGVLIAPDLLV